MPGLLVLLMMTIEGMAFVALLVMLAVVAFVALTMLLVMLAVVAFVALLVMLAVVAFVMLLMMFTGLSRQRMAQTIKQTHHCPPRRFGVTHERQALLSGGDSIDTTRSRTQTDHSSVGECLLGVYSMYHSVRG